MEIGRDTRFTGWPAAGFGGGIDIQPWPSHVPVEALYSFAHAPEEEVGISGSLDM
jgi:hypothetical protein